MVVKNTRVQSSLVRVTMITSSNFKRIQVWEPEWSWWPSSRTKLDKKKIKYQNGSNCQVHG